MDAHDSPPRSDDLQRVIAMTLQRAADISREYRQIDEWVAQQELHIKRARERQEVLKDQYGQCYGTATLFDFDLDAERERALAGKSAPVSLAQPTSIPEKPKTVREVLIELGRIAHPDPIRAGPARKTLTEQYGMEVHEKTVGMTLYRLASKEMAFVRRGIDWYFIPESERAALSGPPDAEPEEAHDFA